MAAPRPRRRQTGGFIPGYDDPATLAALRAALEHRLDALHAVIEARRRRGWQVVRSAGQAPRLERQRPSATAKQNRPGSPPAGPSDHPVRGDQYL